MYVISSAGVKCHTSTVNVTLEHHATLAVFYSACTIT